MRYHSEIVFGCSNEPRIISPVVNWRMPWARRLSSAKAAPFGPLSYPDAMRLASLVDMPEAPTTL